MFPRAGDHGFSSRVARVARAAGQARWATASRIRSPAARSSAAPGPARSTSRDTAGNSWPRRRPTEAGELLGPPALHPDARAPAPARRGRTDRAAGRPSPPRPRRRSRAPQGLSCGLLVDHRRLVDDQLRDRALVEPGLLHGRTLRVGGCGDHEHPPVMRRGGLQQRPQRAEPQIRRGRHRVGGQRRVARPGGGVGRHGRPDVAPLGVGQHQHPGLAQRADGAFQHRVPGGAVGLEERHLRFDDRETGERLDADVAERGQPVGGGGQAPRRQQLGMRVDAQAQRPAADLASASRAPNPVMCAPSSEQRCAAPATTAPRCRRGSPLRCPARRPTRPALW